MQLHSVQKEGKAGGLARLHWSSVPGGDSYIVVRDGKDIGSPLRIEGSQKDWTGKDGR